MFSISKTFRMSAEEEDIIDVKMRLSKRTITGIMILIAVIMIFYGTTRLYTVAVLHGEEDWLDSFRMAWLMVFGGDLELGHVTHLVYWPGPIIFIIGGFLILMDHRRSFIRSVGLYAFAMGVVRIGMALPLMRSLAPPTVALGWIIFILAANLVFSGYSMLSGTTRGRWGMIGGSLGMMAIYMEYFALIMFAYIGIVGDSMGNVIIMIFRDYPNIVVTCIMYAFLIWLLDTDEIRYGDKLTRHIAILQSIDNTYRSVELMTIRRKDAAALMNMDSPRWRDPADGGPAEKEFKFQSNTRMGTSYVTVQKWRDKDELFFTMSAWRKGTSVMAERFAVSKIIPDDEDLEKCTTLNLMGRNRQVIPVTVINTHRDEEVTQR